MRDIALRDVLRWVFEYVIVADTLAAWGAWQTVYKLPTGWPVFILAVVWLVLGLITLLLAGVGHAED